MRAPQSLTTRSTDAPSFRVLSEGRAIPATLQVASVTVALEANSISYAEILIHDGDPARREMPASEASEFAPDKRIRIELGYRQDEDPVFEGVVVRQRIQILGGTAYFQVLCKDPAYVLTLGRNSRIFYDQRDSDVINTLLSSRSVSGRADSTTVKHAQLVQYYASDWDFLLSRAEANGLLVYTKNGRVSVTKPDSIQLPALAVQYGESVIELDAEVDGRTQFGNVQAHAWDSARQSMISFSASNPPAPSPGDQTSSQLGREIGLATHKLYHAGELKGQELQAWASAERQRSQLAKVRGRVRIQGFNAVAPGQLIDLSGLGDHFSGKAFISGVRHEFNGQNWETDIAFGLPPEPLGRRFDDVLPLPAEGLVPAVHGLHIGVVTAIEHDPDNAFRVRVRIPMIDEQEKGIWARLATLDAGQERGSVFLPEVGDEVVIGFLHDDPRNPIVLGQLHSAKHQAPIKGAQNNPLKGFVTRSKLKLLFDDVKKIFSAETPGGRKLILDDKGGTITLQDGNGNKMVFDSSGISIHTNGKLVLKADKNADLSGMNVNIEAVTQLKAEGKMINLSATGNTVIKGAMVQIN
ncbi:MAG: type VI secretion system tip protein VgrG [Bacteroidia bacterium]|nr:type VI secretion system tip protein VgrG [Bacteroidia bacterium]